MNEYNLGIFDVADFKTATLEIYSVNLIQMGNSRFSVITPGYHSRKPKKRSKRGRDVQEKRKRLGLNVWGIDEEMAKIYKQAGLRRAKRKDYYRMAERTIFGTR